MKKVVLVINNCSWYGKREFHTWLPAVPIITALIKDICDFSIIDANVNNMSFDETYDAILVSDADVVLISALSIDYQLQYHKIAELAKKALPNCITVIGGVYPTVLPDQVLKDENIDVIMQGYAEDRLPGLLRALFDDNLEFLKEAAGIGFKMKDLVCINKFDRFLYQSNTIVKPDYSLIDIEKYFQLQQQYSAKNYSSECSEKRSINIISSYGCPYNCFFCANKSLSGSHVVYRPVEDILNEIDFFVKNYHIEQISFMDDNIVANKSRAIELFEKIIKRNYNLEIQIGNLAAWNLNDEIIDLLHKANCTRIGISVESGSQRVLREIMHKPLDLGIVIPLINKLRKNKIMCVVDFLIGLPGETWEEIRSSFSFAEQIDADLCNINIAVPYPGTELYERMIVSGLLPPDFQFDEKFYIKGLVKTSEFYPAELQILRALEWERINAGTKERKLRAMKVLRLSENEFDEYCKSMRTIAMRFITNYG